jgi:multicomponent Na+:H+ antiporter subunit G
VIDMPLPEIISDALILLGLTVMTIGVIGIFRMPDVYTKLHAASKSVFLGVFSLLVAVSFSGNPDIIARAVLIGVLLIFTTPVAAHEIARAAAREQLARIENRGQPPVA